MRISLIAIVSLFHSIALAIEWLVVSRAADCIGLSWWLLMPVALYIYACAYIYARAMHGDYARRAFGLW
jgi:hypothetical protein